MEHVDEIMGMIRDAYPYIMCWKSSRIEPQEPNGDEKKFFRLLEKVKQPLYPNCDKYLSLSFIVKLKHIKCLSTRSKNSFNMLIKLLKDAFPTCNTLFAYDPKKIIDDLDFYYEKINAYKNDCVIYYKENLKTIQCPVCGLSR